MALSLFCDNSYSDLYFRRIEAFGAVHSEQGQRGQGRHSEERHQRR